MQFQMVKQIAVEHDRQLAILADTRLVLLARFRGRVKRTRREHKRAGSPTARSVMRNLLKRFQHGVDLALVHTVERENGADGGHYEIPGLIAGMLGRVDHPVP